MVRVIEHQKVARRRNVRRKLDSTSQPRRNPVTPGIAAGHQARRVRPSRLGAHPRWRRGTGRAADLLVAAGSSGGRMVAGIAGGFLSLLRRLARRSQPSLIRRAARIRSIGRAALLQIDRDEMPLLFAAVVFAVLANMMLLGMNADRILLSGTVKRISLPEGQGLVTQSRMTAQEENFAVIGAVAGVDPSRFARLEVTEYTVQPGDTLGEIALSFGLEMDTLISFNQIEDVRRMQAGATYQIPNRDGLLYTVRRGDSMSSIAAAHGSSVNDILDANDLRSQDIQAGQVLFVPGARLNDTERRIILGELFAWPTRGIFTSGYGMRADPFTGLPRFHNGIDVANSVGTPIRAAASGTVVHVESQIGNYGRFVIVRHPDGFQTLYAHLHTFRVRNGQSVSRGQVLGTMGNTGRSTGPHLHFSVIRNGTFINPLRYLD